MQAKDLTTEEFFELLNKKTKKVIETRKNIDERKEREKNNLKKDSEELANFILKNWRDKARRASEKGRIFVDLYSPKANDNKKIFLLCAPVGNDLTWFTKQGVKPTMHILQEKVAPFKVQYIRMRSFNGFDNHVRLTWAK